MNETIRQLYQRKSVRVFTDEPITDAERRTILEAAIQAPTAGNMCLYSIIDVQDAQLKEVLAQRCDDQLFIKTAPMVLLFLVDWQKWVDIFRQYDQPVGALSEADLLLGAQDCMAAAQNAVVAAQAMGIGSCYIGDILEHVEENRALFNLPPHATPFAMLVFGRPTQQQRSRKKPTRFRVEEVVHIDRYEPLKGAALTECFEHHAGHTGADFERWLKAFAKRKFFCPFREEMNRSCRVILKKWIQPSDK